MIYFAHVTDYKTLSEYSTLVNVSVQVLQVFCFQFFSFVIYIRVFFLSFFLLLFFYNRYVHLFSSVLHSSPRVQTLMPLARYLNFSLQLFSGSFRFSPLRFSSSADYSLSTSLSSMAATKWRSSTSSTSRS